MFQGQLFNPSSYPGIPTLEGGETWCINDLSRMLEIPTSRGIVNIIPDLLEYEIVFGDRFYPLTATDIYESIADMSISGFRGDADDIVRKRIAQTMLENAWWIDLAQDLDAAQKDTQIQAAGEILGSFMVSDIPKAVATINNPNPGQGETLVAYYGELSTGDANNLLITGLSYAAKILRQKQIDVVAFIPMRSIKTSILIGRTLLLPDKWVEQDINNLKLFSNDIPSNFTILDPYNSSTLVRPLHLKTPDWL